MHLWEGAVKEEQFPHTRTPSDWWGCGGIFGASEQSTATGVWRAKQRFLHRGSVPISTHQPEILVCSPTGVGGSWELRLGLWRTDPRERKGWLHEDSLKWASVQQLARRESGKKSGPAREARDHCFGVCKERGFLLCVCTDVRAQPKQSPEMVASHGYHLRHWRQARTATTVAADTEGPVCKCRSLHIPSREPVQHTTAWVP